MLGHCCCFGLNSVRGSAAGGRARTHGPRKVAPPAWTGEPLRRIFAPFLPADARVPKGEAGFFFVVFFFFNRRGLKMFLTFLFSIVEVVTVTCGGGTHAWRTRFWGGSGCFCQRCVMLFLELRARVGTSVCQRSWGRSDHSKITIPPPPSPYFRTLSCWRIRI